MYKHQTVVTLNNTLFEGNKAIVSGGAFRLQTDDFRLYSNFSFYNCTFKKNSGKIGGAIFIQALRAPTYIQHTGPQLSVLFDNCTFSENNLSLDNNDPQNGNEIVCLYDIDKAIIRNTIFTNNKGTALLLVRSTVLFYENTLFSHNSAAYGGALRLCDGSMFFLYNETNIQFENNYAAVSGGAIYAEDSCSQLTPICFYQMDSVYTNLNRTILNFTNNTANYSGDAIYGGSIHTCILLETYLSEQKKNNFVNKLFQIQPNSASMVASDPYRVCLCNKLTKKPNCTTSEIEIDPKYPGQTFHVFVAAVGQKKGTVPAILYVNSSYNVSNSYQLPIVDKCQSKELTVFSVPNVTANINIYLSQNSHTRHFSESDLIIKAPIISCPWIFELDEGEHGYFCNCSKIFNKYNDSRLSCNITSMRITRKGKFWINCTTPNTSNNSQIQKCDEVIMGCFCQHCHLETQTFTPYNLSNQCVVGREGRLCGCCKANYSLSLGPSICLKNELCQAWKTILLLITFFLAGIILVCFLALLNITVTEGTINGMLFLTTCIHANQDIFFQDSYHQYQQISNILEMVISWFNLDFGITVCFYKGMSAYSKHWMEFTFLFYLLLIGIFIIFLSRRSMRFTRLTGHNIVPVLSTVLLFSYSKITNTCVRVLNCASNRYISTKNETRLIWIEDETIDCFTGSHIPLSLCAILFLAAALFYNFCLLFSQCLQRRSHWWVLRWVNKLRPFFEANTGPFRDQYRFWPGFILLLRLTMSINAKIDKSDHRIILITAICFLTLIFSLILPRGVYKKWPLTALEVWLIFLLFVTSITLAVGTNFGHFTSIATIIAALATFLIVLQYHFYKVVSKTKIWKKMVAKICMKPNTREVNEATPILNPMGMPRLIHFAESREPLLEDDPKI